jgi:hypothetical protein
MKLHILFLFLIVSISSAYASDGTLWTTTATNIYSYADGTYSEPILNVSASGTATSISRFVQFDSDKNPYWMATGGTVGYGWVSVDENGTLSSNNIGSSFAINALYSFAIHDDIDKYHASVRLTNNNLRLCYYTLSSNSLTGCISPTTYNHMIDRSYGDGTMVFITGSTGLAVINDSTSGTVIRSGSASGNIVGYSSELYADTYVHMGNGEVGTLFYDGTNLSDKRSFDLSPIVGTVDIMHIFYDRADHALAFFDNSNKVIRYYSLDTNSTLWSYGSGLTGGPITVDASSGRVYAVDGTSIFVLDSSDGSLIDTIELGATVTSIYFALETDMGAITSSGTSGAVSFSADLFGFVNPYCETTINDETVESTLYTSSLVSGSVMCSGSESYNVSFECSELNFDNKTSSTTINCIEPISEDNATGSIVVNIEHPVSPELFVFLALTGFLFFLAFKIHIAFMVLAGAVMIISPLFISLEPLVSAFVMILGSVMVLLGAVMSFYR